MRYAVARGVLANERPVFSPEVAKAIIGGVNPNTPRRQAAAAQFERELEEMVPEDSVFSPQAEASIRGLADPNRFERRAADARFAHEFRLIADWIADDSTDIPPQAAWDRYAYNITPVPADTVSEVPELVPVVAQPAGNLAVTASFPDASPLQLA